MRILVIARSTPFHAGAGGMEAFAFALSTEWVKLGHSVTLVTTPFPNSDLAPALPFKVVTVPGTPGRYTRSWSRRVQQGHWAAPDIVFSVSSAGRGFLRRSGEFVPPVVMQAHGTSLDEIRTKLRVSGWKSFLKIPRNLVWLVRDARDYRKYAAVVGVGSTITRSLGRYPKSTLPRRYVEILNGVTLGSPPTTTWDERSGTVFVGRVHREKGLDVAIKALVGRSHTLVVCGDGPDAAAMKDLSQRLRVSERVTWLGQCSQDDVRACLRRARALVVPSRRVEGLPLSMLEALVEGTPVIGSKGLSEAAEGIDGVTCVGVSADGTEFGEAVSAVLGQSNFDTRALALRSQRFSLDHSAQRYLDLFESIIASLPKETNG